MDEFAGRHDNRVDAKGRVSVPASFRAVLTKDGAEEIFCYPHPERRCLEAGGNRLVRKIHQILEEFPVLSQEREDLATFYFGESETLKIDADGRTILPKRLKDVAGIGDTAVFVGLGDKFQIWEADEYDAFRSEARDRARALRQQLGAGGRSTSGQTEKARE